MSFSKTKVEMSEIAKSPCLEGFWHDTIMIKINTRGRAVVLSTLNDFLSTFQSGFVSFLGALESRV